MLELIICLITLQGMHIKRKLADNAVGKTYHLDQICIQVLMLPCASQTK